MKNILVVVGSGRKQGNTDRLADALIQGATEAGHSVRKAFLGDRQISGCNGCNACRYEKPCVIQDDMQSLYPLYHESDLIVLASPLYFWTISARIKAFLERLYAVAQEDPQPPKGRYEFYGNRECALLMTAADDLFWTFEQAVSYYRFNCVNYLGWTDRGMVLAGGYGGSPGKRRIEQTTHLDSAYQLGKRL